jgi:N-acetylglutamate synthase-like GNAT family acetyltransferase
VKYQTRLATLKDLDVISSLWQEFTEERLRLDPTLSIASDFDFTEYVKQHLSKDSTYCWLLESSEVLSSPNLSNQTKDVGFLCTYIYTESQPLAVPPVTPFQPRKVGVVLALYIKPEYRQLEGMNLLVDTALNGALELQVSDLELLIPEDIGIQSLLVRLGFTKVAVQYTKHLQSPIECFENNKNIDEQVPLRDLETNEIIRDKLGNTIYLSALKDEKGNVLKDSSGLLIYPLPLRNPQTSEWLFNLDGGIALCLPLLDENGKVIESDGLVKFQSPAYEIRDGTIKIKCNQDGCLLFE